MLRGFFPRSPAHRGDLKIPEGSATCLRGFSNLRWPEGSGAKSTIQNSNFIHIFKMKSLRRDIWGLDNNREFEILFFYRRDFCPKIKNVSKNPPVSILTHKFLENFEKLRRFHFTNPYRGFLYTNPLEIAILYLEKNITRNYLTLKVW